jgi:hypothetical protein
MFGNGLTRNRQAIAQIGKRLTIVAFQLFEKHASVLVGKRGEHRVPLR